MKEKPMFPQREIYTRRVLAPQEDWAKLVQDITYESLANAGNVCRLMCQEHPDLLDQIAKGIMKFLSDGDVFEQVARQLFEEDPAYWGDILNDINEDSCKAVIGKVLGEHPINLGDTDDE